MDRAGEERFTYAPQPPDAPSPRPEEGANGAAEPTPREETRHPIDAPEHDASSGPEDATYNGHATPAVPNPYDAALALNGCLPDGEKVERDLLLTDAARKLGIFGAPTFAIGPEIFWGDDRLEDALAFAARR